MFKKDPHWKSKLVRRLMIFFIDRAMKALYVTCLKKSTLEIGLVMHVKTFYNEPVHIENNMAASTDAFQKRIKI